MRTACRSLPGALSVVLRRSLLLAGFLLGGGLVALVSAGSAHADEHGSSSRPPEARGGSASGSGLLGGLLKPVTDPVLSGVSQVLAPVVGVVEPVTAPLLAPVTESLSPVLEVLAPVTAPLPGVEPARTASVPAPVVDEADVGTTVPAETPSPVKPSTAGVPVAVEVVGPLWTTSTSEVGTSDVVAVDSRWYGRPGRGPASPGQDLGGAVGAASSGGNVGGSPGQADLPGYRGVGSGDSGRVVPAQRWLVRPWCFVFGRHHPS
jgi:hypothetical protein